MPRYIEIEKFLDELDKQICSDCIDEDAHCCSCGVGCARGIAKDLDTADVVPKSEVEELKADLEVWKQNRFNIYQSFELYKMTRQEVAREIFAEIDVMFRKYYNRCSEPTELKLLEPLCQAERFIINEMWHDVAELKKKYTEGEPNG